MSKIFIFLLISLSLVQNVSCQAGINSNMPDPETHLKAWMQNCHKIHGCVPKPDEEGGYDCSNGDGWFECITRCQDNNRAYAKQFWAKICADPNATEEVKYFCSFQNQ